jgi:hypothetical protein
MSATEKAFNALKSILTHQERMDGLEGKIVAIGGRLERLAESHVALRERVSEIEGYLKAATGTPFSGPGMPRIKG